MTVIVALTGAAVVAGLFEFNRSAVSYNLYILGNLIGLIFVPMLAILLVFREEPGKFGLVPGSSRQAWYFVGAAFLAMLAGCVYASNLRVFQVHYPLFRLFPEFAEAFSRYPLENPWKVAPWMMLYAEASYGLYMFCWEFFFRGYLLFGLSRSIGWWAVLVQAAAFCLLHLGKPPLEMILSFPAGIILGMLALNAKSFVPGFVLHWAVSVSLNVMVVMNRPQ